VVLGELGEILETAAEDMTVTVRPPSNMGVEVFGRYPVSRTGNDLHISIGRLVRGSSRQLVLQLSVPHGIIGDTHRVEVVPDWRSLDTGTRSQGASMSVVFTVATEAEVTAELPDPDVGRMVARMWQNHLRLDSTLLNSEGRLLEAEQLVRGAMPDFHRYCSTVPGTDEFVADLDDHESLVSSPMAQSLSLESVDSTKRSLKGDKDFRVNKRS